MTVTIRPADLGDPRVAALLDDHLAEMEPTAPPESRHALTIDQFRMPGVRLWVAGSGHDVVGSVALKDLGRGHLELKTMRVSASVRGHGVGRRLLDHALTEARRSGATRVSLETGVVPLFDAARALYVRSGFVACEPRGVPAGPAQHVPHAPPLIRHPPGQPRPGAAHPIGVMRGPRRQEQGPVAGAAPPAAATTA